MLLWFFCLVLKVQLDPNLPNCIISPVSRIKWSGFFTGFMAVDDVIQNSTLWTTEGGKATMDCRHTKGATYYQMYWFQQLPGEGMKMIVLTTANSKPKFEPDFEEAQFSTTKTDALSGTLTVEKVEPKHQAVYFCAVSEHSATDGSGCRAKTSVHRHLNIQFPLIKGNLVADTIKGEGTSPTARPLLICWLPTVA